MIELSKELNSLDVLSLNEDGQIILDLAYLTFEKSISVEEGKHVEIFLKNYNDKSLNFFIQNNASLDLKILNFESKNTLNLHGNVCKNGIFNIIYGDFSSDSSTINSNVILYGDDSKSEFRFASLVNQTFTKKYNISFDHLGLNSNSVLDGFGVCLDKSLLTVTGVSHIEKGAIKSNASQHIKAILFDKESKAKASPTLKIDCDDIKASHGCAVGALNEDHLYYLQSRGLSETEARKLITYGYLLPITTYFDEDSKKEIEEVIYRSI